MYKIISHHDLIIFQNAIEKELKEGWSLQGGVSAYSHLIDNNPEKIRITYCQAVIK